MKKLSTRKVSLSAVFILLLWVPAMLYAQSTEPPSVGAPIVREGDFAIELSAALGLGQTEDEVEAETWLGEAGIAPRNGWIADYPVTPDIVGELQTSVGRAADANKISMDSDEAQRQFIAVCAQFGLSVTPYTGPTRALPPSCDNYPNPATINEYYSDQGPPVVTYYCPPPDYYYLYAWVPYPYWWSGFWFSGFYILHDFHKHHFVHNRTKFVSNHFNDVKHNKVYRVDPVKRFKGKTFAGIGARGSKNFVRTGVPRSDRNIFNAPRERMAPGMVSPPRGTPKKGGPPAGRRGTISQPPRGGGPPAGSRGTISQPPHDGSPPAGSRETISQPPDGSSQPRGSRGTISQPPHGTSQPRGSRGTISQPPRGSGGFMR